MSKDDKSKNDKDAGSDRDKHYATLRRAHRDQKRERGEIPTPSPKDRRKARAEDWKAPQLAPEQVFLYGLHTVRAALDNKQRQLIRLSATLNALQRLEIGEANPPCPLEIVTPQEIEKIVGPEAIHQGVMLETRPLPVRRLEALKESPLVLVLDQVTDPHNVGAIMRSAAAFDALGIVTPDRHAPPESGTIARAASGALEIVPWVRVVNLARALEEIAEAGFWRVGLTGEATQTLTQAMGTQRVTLVLGAEGEGMRQNTASHCDELARLPISHKVESLNVSNAAAIALYAVASR